MSQTDFAKSTGWSESNLLKVNKFIYYHWQLRCSHRWLLSSWKAAAFAGFTEYEMFWIYLYVLYRPQNFQYDQHIDMSETADWNCSHNWLPGLIWHCLKSSNCLFHCQVGKNSCPISLSIGPYKTLKHAGKFVSLSCSADLSTCQHNFENMVSIFTLTDMLTGAFVQKCTANFACHLVLGKFWSSFCRVGFPQTRSLVVFCASLDIVGDYGICPDTKASIRTQDYQESDT